MSLEVATKELERLETQMQDMSTDGGECKHHGRWCDGATTESRRGQSSHDSRRGQATDTERQHQSRGVMVTEVGKVPRFDSAFEGTRKTCLVTDGMKREESPTRVHLRRTGSVEIEHGDITRSARPPTTTFHHQGADSGPTSGIDCSRRSRDFGRRESGDSRRWGQEDSWKVAGLDERKLRRRIGISSVPSDAAVGTTNWRTEADADLSDIKATMRRIDAGGGSTGGVPSYAYLTAGNVARESTASASAAAACSRSRADCTSPSGDQEGMRYSEKSSVGACGLYSSLGGESAKLLGWGASSGSKAVLSALRALQDKIRKLEGERDRAAVEATTLRRQIAALEAENERTTKVNVAGEQEKQLASRLAYERLQADKIAVDVRLCKVEEQKRQLAAEIEASKERAQKAEAARRAADCRISALEDRVLGLRRQEEAERSTEIRAVEEATRACQEKAGQVEALEARVADMEASVATEKSLRAKAEKGLARALSAKGQLERFLEGVLRVNEELVRSAVPSTTAKRVKNKSKRPKATTATAASCATTAAPPPCCVGTGRIDTGTGVGLGNGANPNGEFNVGTHTAKRAKTRVRKMKKRLLTSTSATIDMNDQAPAEGTRRLAPKMSIKDGTSGGTRMSLRSTSSTVGGRNTTSSERAVPFVQSGSTSDSYNVVSAVSKALKTARKGRPRESLSALYADIGAAVLESSSDVPFMLQQSQGGIPPRRPAWRAKVPSGVTVKTSGRSRTLLDVAMPDLGGLNLSELPSQERQPRASDVSANSVKKGPHKEYWNPRWDEGEGGSVARDDEVRVVRNGTRDRQQAFDVFERSFGDEDKDGDGKCDASATCRRKMGDVDEPIPREDCNERTLSSRQSRDYTRTDVYERDDGDKEGVLVDDTDASAEGDEGGDGNEGSEEEGSDSDDEALMQHEDVNFSGIPSSDGGLSSGDERAWRGLERR